ncbi:hypothetical protein F5883DRAFT_557582 [Diaporthe sp. PMI_573]|nr:hypothetical protein F5883DRAFT_557582 [Diaporthaceae sp. PMI_573]
MSSTLLRNWREKKTVLIYRPLSWICFDSILSCFLTHRFPTPLLRSRGVFLCVHIVGAVIHSPWAWLVLIVTSMAESIGKDMVRFPHYGVGESAGWLGGGLFFQHCGIGL